MPSLRTPPTMTLRCGSLGQPKEHWARSSSVTQGSTAIDRKFDKRILDSTKRD